jgi:4-carboxymuconolactone decarboxylase
VNATPRLPRLRPAELNDEQLALYQQITSGPRAAGPQHFALQDEHGALNGPFGVMLHAPGIGGPLQELGAAVRYRTSMSDRIREIAILTVATATGSEFERYAHESVGRAVGLSEDEMHALRTGTFTSPAPVEEAAYALCRRLQGDPRPLDDGEYQAAAEVLGHADIVELVVLVGYYRTLAQLMDVFAIGAPSSDKCNDGMKYLPSNLACMTDSSPTALLPIVHYDDTQAALRFLIDVLGFQEILAATDDDGDVVHAELCWSGGGGLVVGGTKHTDSVHGEMRAGSSAIYLATDDVDAIHDRVRKACGEVVEPPHNTKFGSGAESYTSTVRDPEGNLWTFGTYRGAF